MDKYEYNLKVEQMKQLAESGDFKQAGKIADAIEWRKVKNGSILNLVSSIYEAVGEFKSAKEILMIAYERAPLGRQLAYRLSLVSVKTNEIEEAEEFYLDFVDMAPMDSARYILQYEIANAKGADDYELINILKAFNDQDMEENWAYKLAKLYAKVGDKENCVKLCDEISLWFNEGKYVSKALELKQKYTPLTKGQKERLNKSEKRGEQQDTIEFSPAKISEIKENKPEQEKIISSEDDFDIDHMEVKPEDNIDLDTAGNQQELSQNVDILMKDDVKAESVFAATKEEDETEKEDLPLEQIFKLEGDGQISLDIPEPSYIEKQITGQLSINEILKQLETQGVLKPDTVNGAIGVVNEVTGVLPKLNLPSEDEMELTEDKTQVKLDIDTEGNLMVQEPEESVSIEGEDPVYELGVRDLISDNELAKLNQDESEEDEADDVLKLLERLEAEHKLEPEEFDIPETPQEGRYYLSEENKQVFEQFIGITGLEHALAKTLDNLAVNYDRDGTSKKNNVIIMGEAKSGKTTLALNIIKVANKERGRKGRKVAKVNGNIINKKGILTAMPKLLGSDLIIEDAGVINSSMLRQMLDTFKGYTDEMIIVLEDNRVIMERMLEAHQSLDSMFENKIIIKEYDINEWVGYAKAYAKEKGYIVDEVGTLALYAKVDQQYGKNQGLEKSDVEDIIIKAIESAEKKGIGRLFGVFSKKSKEGDFNVLREGDFN